MFWKLGIRLALGGFLAIGILLITNHFGLAIRIANYVYFLLLVSVFGGLVKYEGKK